MGSDGRVPYNLVRMVKTVLLLAALGTLAPLALAAEPELPAPAPEPSEAPQRSPSLGLDDLLRPRGGFLPVPATGTPEVRGGRDEVEWREAFGRARHEVAELEGRVAILQQKIREASSGAWSYAPIGSGEAATDPEVLKLRAELKRDRQSLETAHARLRELEVEGSLSGVPDRWMEPEPVD